jgi:hypothetical protein
MRNEAEVAQRLVDLRASYEEEIAKPFGPLNTVVAQRISKLHRLATQILILQWVLGINDGDA